jgi:hypothetical protein
MDRVKVILNGVNAIRNSHRDRINLLLFKAYCLTKRFAVHINTLEELRLYLKAAPMVTYQKYIFDIAKPLTIRFALHLKTWKVLRLKLKAASINTY